MTEEVKPKYCLDLVSQRAFRTNSTYSCTKVNDVDGLYVTANGKVLNAKFERISVDNTSDKSTVTLDDTTYDVDRLVLSSFERIPTRFVGKKVIHLNGNNFDNEITNLAWAPFKGCAEDVDWLKTIMYPTYLALNRTRQKLMYDDITNALNKYFRNPRTIEYFHDTLFDSYGIHISYSLSNSVRYYDSLGHSNGIIGFKFIQDGVHIAHLTIDEAIELAQVDRDTFIQKMLAFASPAFPTGWMFVANRSLKWIKDNQYGWPWADNKLPIGLRNREAYAIMQLVTHERVIEKLNPDMTVERYVSFQDALDKNPEMTTTKLRNALRAPRVQVCDVTNTYWGYFPEITDAMVELY